MRILFVTGEFPPMQGGVGDYTRELGLALRDLGCEVHVGTSVQADGVPGLSVHPLIARWDWSCWKFLLHLVNAEQPDIVHVQYQAAAYAMHPAVNLLPWRIRSLGGKQPMTAVTFHDLKVPYLFPKAGRLRRWVVNELARRSDAAITTNQEDYQTLSRLLSCPPALIPIGSNITPTLPPDFDRTAWRARWGAGPGDFLLCFFGFVNARKGLDTLLRGLHILATEPDATLQPLLLMIGGQTGSSDPTNLDYLAQMRALIEGLGLEGRIRWTGYIPAAEVTASFLASDLCVLPFRDGASFLHGTFHAALAHGVPILSTHPRVPLPELVDRGNIYLVPPEDPQALAQAIVALAEAPKLRQALGAGAKVLSERFRWDRIAADTLELYRAREGRLRRRSG